MECLEPVIRYDFICKRAKQKNLIEIIMNYSELDLGALATILSVPLEYLSSVHNGVTYLIGDSERKLGEMFLVMFS